MIKLIFQKLLENSGRNYTIDPQIPDKLLYKTLFKRFIMLCRGLFFTRKKIYLGKKCTITNKSNIQFGKNVTIESYSIIDGFAKNKIILGDGVKIGSFSKLLSTSHLATFGIGMKIGNNSAVGDFTHFGATGGLEIGNDVIMGSYVSFHSENHNFSDSNKLIREQGVNSKGIKIGNNIWVGAKVTFLDGCEVGDNSIVAAGAVVNSVFPSNSLIGGVPAKIIKQI
jgi:acetyltransferase-like isoleucine patch superfamily enzyme